MSKKNTKSNAKFQFIPTHVLTAKINAGVLSMEVMAVVVDDCTRLFDSEEAAEGRLTEWRATSPLPLTGDTLLRSGQNGTRIQRNRKDHASAEIKRIEGQRALYFTFEDGGLKSVDVDPIIGTASSFVYDEDRVEESKVELAHEDKDPDQKIVEEIERLDREAAVTTTPTTEKCPEGQHHIVDGVCTKCLSPVSAGPASLAVVARGSKPKRRARKTTPPTSKPVEVTLVNPLSQNEPLTLSTTVTVSPSGEITATQTHTVSPTQPATAAAIVERAAGRSAGKTHRPGSVQGMTIEQLVAELHSKVALDKLPPLTNVKVAKLRDMVRKARNGKKDFLPKSRGSVTGRGHVSKSGTTETWGVPKREHFLAACERVASEGGPAAKARFIQWGEKRLPAKHVFRVAYRIATERPDAVVPFGPGAMTAMLAAGLQVHHESTAPWANDWRKSVASKEAV